MEVNLDESSWLNSTNLLQSGQYVFWDQTVYPEIPLSADDTYITLTQLQARRIDLVAYDQYGNSGYFWVLLLANNFAYPTELYEGITLRVPSLNTINNILNKNI